MGIQNFSAASNIFDELSTRGLSFLAAAIAPSGLRERGLARQKIFMPSRIAEFAITLALERKPLSYRKRREILLSLVDAKHLRLNPLFEIR
jgi:hypothetical protein